MSSGKNQPVYRLKKTHRFAWRPQAPGITTAAHGIVTVSRKLRWPGSLKSISSSNAHYPRSSLMVTEETYLSNWRNHHIMLGSCSGCLKAASAASQPFQQLLRSRSCDCCQLVPIAHTYLRNSVTKLELVLHLVTLFCYCHFHQNSTKIAFHSKIQLVLEKGKCFKSDPKVRHWPSLLSQVSPARTQALFACTLCTCTCDYPVGSTSFP